MEKNALQSFIDIIKSNGAVGVIAILLFYFGNTFNSSLNEFNNRLTDITKEIVEIKIQLASMRATYIDKDETRKIVEQAFNKHIQQYHNNKTN